MTAADAAWREALELLQTAAALPGYCGPDVQAVERVAAGIAEVRGQLKNWALEENLRAPPGRAARLVSRPVSRPAGRRLLTEIVSRR